MAKYLAPREVLVLLAATLGAACGGGGGGGSGPTPPNSAVALVSVSLPVPDLPVGGTAHATATVTDAGGSVLGRAVTWTSSSAAIAAVGSDGTVTALSPGSATISATSEGKSGSANLRVANVAQVVVSPTTLSLYRGQSANLTAGARDVGGVSLTGRTVSWQSSDTTVIRVSSAGVATARQTGSATVSAVAEGIIGTVPSTVAPVPVKVVSVTPTSQTLVSGEFMRLNVVTRDSSGAVVGGRVVTFAASDTSVARVLPNGIVIARATGSATITATSEGVSGFCALTVAGAGPPVASLQLTSPQVVVLDSGTSTTPTFVARDASNQVVPSPVLWYQGGSAAAVVSRSGVVTGQAPGQGLVFGVAASNANAQDSLMVVVTPSGGAVLMTDLNRFQQTSGATVVANLVLDLRSSGILLGSATVVVTWDPSVLQGSAEDAIGASAVTAVANTSGVASGVYRLAVTSAAGITGRVVLRRLTFFVLPSGTGKSATLATTAIEVNTADTFASVLSRVASLSLPIISH